MRRDRKEKGGNLMRTDSSVPKSGERYCGEEQASEGRKKERVKRLVVCYCRRRQWREKRGEEGYWRIWIVLGCRTVRGREEEDGCMWSLGRGRWDWPEIRWLPVWCYSSSNGMLVSRRGRYLTERENERR
ncbi:hypothetical protein HAX54_028840 [Datura stramonium]|uniref:Uncharacterized protein n=1 Tax=Datura stramonium TaxID=4076 RepID=A0ABS8V6Y7_DATST|nr:hypothetical protein [Datura stramonium]